MASLVILTPAARILGSLHPDLPQTALLLKMGLLRIIIIMFSFSIAASHTMNVDEQKTEEIKGTAMSDKIKKIEGKDEKWLCKKCIKFKFAEKHEDDCKKCISLKDEVSFKNLKKPINC